MWHVVGICFGWGRGVGHMDDGVGAGKQACVTVIREALRRDLSDRLLNVDLEELNTGEPSTWSEQRDVQ